MSYYNLCGISYIQVDHSTVIFQKEKKGWKLIKKKNHRYNCMPDSNGNSQDREK
jgi:hypothetical protein